jgi:hypothetical protein
MHLRLRLLAPVLVVSLACAHPSSQSTRVVAPTSQLPVTADTSLNARLQRDLAARAAASERVVAVRIVRPDTLRLHPGTRVSLREVQLEARDSSGQVVSPFVPAFAVVDRSILTLAAGEFSGQRAGRTIILVGIARADPVSGQRRMVAMDTLPAVVTPAPQPGA